MKDDLFGHFCEVSSDFETICQVTPDKKVNQKLYKSLEKHQYLIFFIMQQFQDLNNKKNKHEVHNQLYQHENHIPMILQEDLILT